MRETIKIIRFIKPNAKGTPEANAKHPWTTPYQEGDAKTPPRSKE